MRFLRFLCNLLMFIAVTIGISVVQVGLYDLTALQSENIPEIKISADDESDIAYFDNYAFWAEDIKANLDQPAKYRIRNWASWSWWKKGMAWADKGLDTIIAAVKPIVVPVAQVNAINNYYGYDINDFEKYLSTYYETEEALNNALYEVYVIFNEGYETAYTVDGTKLISEHAYTGKYAPRNEETGEYLPWSIEDEMDVEYSRWVKKNGKLYNTLWKLKKYNSDTYDKYFKKFIDHEVVVNEDGSLEYTNRHIKTAVTVMYYQQFVSLIIALVFVLKYPIALGQARIVGKGKKETL